MYNQELYKDPLFEVRKISDLKDMIEQSSRIFGEKPAFLVNPKDKDEYVPITYKQYKSDIDSLGTVLIEMGLKDKRVAVIGENSYEWAVTYLSVVNGVGVVVPIDKELPEVEVVSLLKRSEAEAVIFSGKLSEMFLNILKKDTFVKYFINMALDEDNDDFLSFINLLKKGEGLLSQGNREYIEAKIDSEKMRIMLFTSGTTDVSKAVMLSHRNIRTNIMDMCRMIKFDGTDTVLSVLPMHHTYECTCGFLAQIYSGSTIGFCQGLRHIVKNLQQTKATIMLAVPLIVETMYKKIWEQAAKDPKKLKKLKVGIALSNSLKTLGIDFSRKIFRPIHETFGGNIRLFITGAAAVDPQVSKGFRELGIDILQGYGLTECSPVVSVCREKQFKDASIGLPLPSNEVKIVDQDEEGIGEVVVRGDNVMIGYYNNEEATKRVLKDGWVYTGDLGYIDKEGFIYITGRRKNLIVTKNGKNIFPEELETLISRPLFIKESMVYGKPDKDGDILVCASIVIDKEYLTEQYGEKPTPELIESLVSEQVKDVNHSIPLYKHIREFDIRENEFQKTTTKKIKRYLEIKK